MVEVSNNFIQECEANVGTYKFGKIKVNHIDDNPLNYEQGAYSSSNGAKIDAEQSIRYNKLVECEPNFKYKIELGNSAYKMKIVTYNANQAFIAAHDNLAEGSELTTESTAAYISVTIYSNDTLEGTNITLNNTIRNSEILGAELKGNTIQDGTPTPSSPVPVNNVTGEQVVRVCGKNLLDNSILELFNNNKYIKTPNYNTKGSIIVSPNTTYTLSTQNTSFTDNNVYEFDENNNRTTLVKHGITPQHSFWFTTSATAKTISFYSNNNGLEMPSDLDFQIVVGNQAPTSFEEYQGKDYEINLGKNLLKTKTLVEATTNGITFTPVYDGNKLQYVNVNGTATATAVYNLDSANIDYINTYTNELPSGTYILDDFSGSTSPYMAIFFRYFTIGSTSVTNIDSVDNSRKLTIDNTIKYASYIRINTGTTVNNMKFYPQLEKGNTETSYAPYFTPIELNKIGDYQDYIRKGTGKNLFIPTLKVDDTNINTIRCSVSLNGDEYTFSATGSDCYFGNIVGTGNAYNKLFGTLYDVSGITNLVFKPTNSAFDKNYVCYYDNNKVSLGYGQINNNTGLITPIANTKYIGFRIGISNSVSGTNYTTKIQLEKAPSATYYEPYGSKDKWYIEKNVAKVVLANTGYFASGGVSNIFYTTFITNYATNNNIPYSNQYTGINNVSGAGGMGSQANNTIGFINQSGSTVPRLYVKDTRFSTEAELNNWIKNNPLEIYYLLANPTYTLIENEELIEQLDALSHAETQEGTTNITSSGILPAILEVTPNLIESIRGKQTTPIVGYNITGDDDLINFKITSKADSNGNILGATSQSQVDIEIFNENNTHNLENKQVYISTGLNETEGNYCKWQPFTITQTKDTQTKNHTTYTGYDDMMRGNEAYIDNVDYGEEGITLYDFTCNLAKEMGMALGNTTMTNGDFIVKGNNFTNNEAKLVVLKNVAQMAGGFAMIDRDNLLRIVELSPEEAMTPIELTTNLYTEDFQNSAKFGEINEFAIGETNIETNAIVRSDDASIAKNGVKKIEILDNMFLGLLEDKETAIEPLWDAFNGFSYYPFKTPYNGYPYIDLGDKINITDINSNIYGTLVLNNVFEYNGGYKGNIGAEALSITAAKYKTNNTLSKQFRKVGIDIDRVEGEITAEIAAREDTTEQVSQLSQTVNEINSTVSTTTTTVSDLETRVQTNETSISQNADSITATVTRVQKTEDDVETLQTNTEDVVNQLVFGDDGLTISAKGSTSDDMKLNLTNDAIKFLYNNNAVLTINGSVIEFSNASFRKLDLGNYVWQAEDDDSLSLIYEGD